MYHHFPNELCRAEESFYARLFSGCCLRRFGWPRDEPLKNLLAFLFIVLFLSALILVVIPEGFAFRSLRHGWWSCGNPRALEAGCTVGRYWVREDTAVQAVIDKLAVNNFMTVDDTVQTSSYNALST